MIMYFVIIVFLYIELYILILYMELYILPFIENMMCQDSNVGFIYIYI
jgi:hypothetical protein